MKEIRRQYLNNEIKLERYQIIGICLYLLAFSGVFGWIYEFIFYYFNSGMKTFYWQGGNFLPWINIYAIGAFLILITVHKLKKNPFLVFFSSMFVTGILEYVSGFIIHRFFHTRLWDYNIEILNFGNIDGYVCFRSVFIFGISALFLVYLVVPFFIYLSKKLSKKTFLTIGIVLASIILFDEFYNLLFARIFHLPRAYDIYSKWGIPYLRF